MAGWHLLKGVVDCNYAKMKDLAMHIMDITRNSVRAGASLIGIRLDVYKAEKLLKMTIKDNGCGMDSEMILRVTDPFVTSRTTRKVGLGLPFLKMNAEQTGGALSIQSKPGEGTVVTATFYCSHIDCVPLGDIQGTVALIMSGNPNQDFEFEICKDESLFALKSTEIKEALDGISIANPSVAKMIGEMVDTNLLSDLQ